MLSIWELELTLTLINKSLISTLTQCNNIQTRINNEFVCNTNVESIEKCYSLCWACEDILLAISSIKIGNSLSVIWGIVRLFIIRSNNISFPLSSVMVCWCNQWGLIRIVRNYCFISTITVLSSDCRLNERESVGEEPTSVNQLMQLVSLFDF